MKPKPTDPTRPSSSSELDPSAGTGAPLSRRKAIQLGLTGGATLMLARGFPKLARAEARQPNIVFILSDNQRWDFLGCAGHPFLKTPNVDRLAREGVHFKNAFVTTSLCSPSRASFLTGQYAHAHGVKNNTTAWNNANTTFLERLKSQGYDTAFIGKWHMPGDLPVLRGVDLFVTFTIEKGQGRYIDCPLVVNGSDRASRKPYITEELTDYALEFMTQSRDRPFCIELSHKAVHHPWIPPADLAKLYENEKPPFPGEFDPFVLLMRGHTFEGFNVGLPDELYRNYARVVTALDAEVGRVLDKLDELGLSENTIVIFASDNGFFWGEHKLAGTGRWAYEESIRVPLIVRAPGIVGSPGRAAEQMLLNVDVAPTILELAGLTPAPSMHGTSFAPILRSPGAPGRDAWRYEYFNDFPYRVPTLQAVRTPTHVYVEYEGRRRPELFDLTTDPHQKKNLFGTPEGDALAAALQRRLHELRAAEG